MEPIRIVEKKENKYLVEWKGNNNKNSWETKANLGISYRSIFSIQMDKASRKSHSRPPLSICGKPGPMLLLHDPVKNYFSKWFKINLRMYILNF